MTIFEWNMIMYIRSCVGSFWLLYQVGSDMTISWVCNQVYGSIHNQMFITSRTPLFTSHVEWLIVLGGEIFTVVNGISLVFLFSFSNFPLDWCFFSFFLSFFFLLPSKFSFLLFSKLISNTSLLQAFSNIITCSVYTKQKNNNNKLRVLLLFIHSLVKLKVSPLYLQVLFLLIN